MKAQKLTTSFIIDFISYWSEEFVGESLQKVGYSYHLKSRSNFAYMMDSESQYVILAVAPASLNMDHINEWQKARFDLMRLTNSKRARVIIVAIEAHRKYHELFKLFKMEFWFISKEDMAFRIQQIRPDMLLEFKPDGEFDRSIQRPKLTAKNILQALEEKGDGPELNGAYVFWLKNHHAEHAMPRLVDQAIDEFDLSDLSEDELEVLREGNSVKQSRKYEGEDEESYDVELKRSLLPEQIISECSGLFGYDRDGLERLLDWFNVIRSDTSILLIDGNSTYEHTRNYRRGRVNALDSLQFHYRDKSEDEKIDIEKLQADLNALQSVSVYAGPYPNHERLTLFTGFSITDKTPQEDTISDASGRVWAVSFDGLEMGNMRFIQDVIEHLKHHAGKVESYGGLSIWSVRKMKRAPLSKITVAQPCPRCFQKARLVKEVPEDALLLGADHFRAPEKPEFRTSRRPKVTASDLWD